MNVKSLTYAFIKGAAVECDLKEQSCRHKFLNSLVEDEWPRLVAIALALHEHIMHALEGSGGMLPQEDF